MAVSDPFAAMESSMEVTADGDITSSTPYETREDYSFRLVDANLQFNSTVILYRDQWLSVKLPESILVSRVHLRLGNIDSNTYRRVEVSRNPLCYQSSFVYILLFVLRLELVTLTLIQHIPTI